jgi:hypothetical protein
MWLGLLAVQWAVSKLNVPEGLGEQLLPVAETACHGTQVDEIKVVLSPGPVLLGVVDFKLDVWRNPTKSAASG